MIAPFVASLTLMVRSPALEADTLTGKIVWCAPTQDDWNQETASVGLPPTVNGFSQLDENAMYLAPWVCDTLTSPPAPTQAYAMYSLTFVHELMHLDLHTRDEGTADCMGLLVQQYFLRKFFHASPQVATILYTLAWAAHLTKPPAYQGQCTYQPTDVITPLNP